MNIQELEKLNELKEKGILTEEEFNLKKKEILSGNSNAPKTVNASNRSILNSYLDCLKKYFQFKGRSSRYDFWSFILINVLVNFLLGVFDGMLGTSGMLSVLYSLGVFIPMLAIQVRLILSHLLCHLAVSFSRSLVKIKKNSSLFQRAIHISGWGGWIRTNE